MGWCVQGSSYPCSPFCYDWMPDKGSKHGLCSSHHQPKPRENRARPLYLLRSQMQIGVWASQKIP